jgi:hypothetical protein
MLKRSFSSVKYNRNLAELLDTVKDAAGTDVGKVFIAGLLDGISRGARAAAGMLHGDVESSRFERNAEVAEQERTSTLGGMTAREVELTQQIEAARAKGRVIEMEEELAEVESRIVKDAADRLARRNEIAKEEQLAAAEAETGKKVEGQE